MHKIIMSGEYKEFIDVLKNKGYDCVLTQPNPFLPYPVRFHVDLQFLKIDTNKAFVLKNCNVNIENYKLLKTSQNPSGKYPKDCLLNCLIIGKKAFGNAKALDENVLEYFKQNNIEFINTKQGYAKCSTLVLDEKHCVTADTSIYNALKENKIDVLKINAGNIELKGYDYGFIGGASGKIGDTIIFAGSLKTHPQGKEIKKYIENLNFKILELGNNKLIDIGAFIEL